MPEIVKRLAPKRESLRELFLKSGNLCAFPGCGALMMNAKGVFIGQLCHIEAAEEGGERFNAKMSNENRRQASNLMLMCYPHHQETNDVATFTVAKLQKMKAQHEGRFAHPDRAILENLKDWTTIDEPTKVTSLKRMNAVLGWKNSELELAEAVDELNSFIEGFRNVPIEVRQFAGIVAQRAVKMSGTRAVQDGTFGIKIIATDLRDALRLSERTLVERVSQLDAYGLGDIDEIDTDVGPKGAVRLRAAKSGWGIWTDLVLFCQQANEPLEAFTQDLDFGRLDVEA